MRAHRLVRHALASRPQPVCRPERQFLTSHRMRLSVSSRRVLAGLQANAALALRPVRVRAPNKRCPPWRRRHAGPGAPSRHARPAAKYQWPARMATDAQPVRLRWPVFRLCLSPLSHQNQRWSCTGEPGSLPGCHHKSQARPRRTGQPPPAFRSMAARPARRHPARTPDRCLA